jgi:hypothetical protein
MPTRRRPLPTSAARRLSALAAALSLAAAAPLGAVADPAEPEPPAPREGEAGETRPPEAKAKRDEERVRRRAPAELYVPSEKVPADSAVAFPADI